MSKYTQKYASSLPWPINNTLQPYAEILDRWAEKFISHPVKTGLELTTLATEKIRQILRHFLVTSTQPSQPAVQDSELIILGKNRKIKKLKKEILILKSRLASHNISANLTEYEKTTLLYTSDEE